MKILQIHFSYYISGIPANLIKTLGWSDKQKLRPYVDKDTLIIEKLDDGNCITLYQIKNKQNYFCYSIGYMKKTFLDSLVWRAGTYLVGTCFGDKLIIKQSDLISDRRSNGFHYVYEKIKLDNFILTKMQELFEA